MNATPENNAAPVLEITIEQESWPPLLDGIEPRLRRLAALCLGRVSEERGLPALAGRAFLLEISLLLTDDSRIRELNRSYRGRDTPTNVLSFPQYEDAAEIADHLADTPEALTAGDIVMAFETLAREAGESGISLEDHALHLFVHGFLHLLGYDHEDERDAEEMENLEMTVLSTEGIKNPYAASA